MGIIYHIAEQGAWTAALNDGQYAPPSLEKEGFIHCSTRKQTLDTANNFFRGQYGLLLLCIDEEKTQAELRYDPPTGGSVHDPNVGTLFPHLHGPLNIGAVIQVLEFPPGADGTFSFPAEIGV